MKFRNSGVGLERLPKFGVLRPVIGTGREEQTGRADGKIIKMSRISPIRPRAAVENVRKKPRDNGAHAGTILQLIVPDALETGGEQNADSGQPPPSPCTMIAFM